MSPQVKAVGALQLFLNVMEFVPTMVPTVVPPIFNAQESKLE